MSDTTKKRHVYITTSDNPWNPHTNSYEWFNYDEAVLGYGSSGLLARIYVLLKDQLGLPDDSALTEEEELRLREQAIDEIIKLDKKSLNIGYKKLVVVE